MANTIHSCLESWKTVDFSSLLKDLDSIANEIANEKDQSDISRRILIDKNKKFKDQVSVDTRKEVAPLLKSFQTEVDQLNKRNKSLETHLLTFYKRLIDLPDPCSALEIAATNQKRLQKYQDIAGENKRLLETLEEYQREFSSVKNQEVTIKQLRDRVRELEANMSTNISNKCKELEREFSTNMAEREREFLKEAQEAALKLTESEKKIAFLEKNLVDNQSELFLMKNQFDELSAAKKAETDILVVENERTNEKLKQIEARLSSVDHLDRDNLILLKKQERENESEMNEISELQMELAAKDNEILKLTEEIRHINLNLIQTEKKLQNDIDTLESDLSKKKEMIEKLHRDLLSRRDYDEIKQELLIIKSIEFQDLEQAGTTEKDPLSPAYLIKDAPLSVAPTKSIEQLLNEKNRHLQNQLLQMKASFTQSQIELEKLKEENRENQLKIKEKNQLINQLENDLHNVKTLESVSSRMKGESPSESIQNLASEGTGQMRSNKINEAEILANVLENNDDLIKESGQHSLLAIVQSQRDRFKIRSQELEANAQIFQQTIEHLQGDNERLSADNVKLYEKVRFLQSYSGTPKSRFEDSTFSRYSKEYEANINPFETFNKHEKQRQYQALPPHEKIVLSMGKFVMGNRTARLFAFLYSLLMHFLIFVVLYKLAYTETCVRDQAFQCRKEFAEHMKSAHGR